MAKNRNTKRPVVGKTAEKKPRAGSPGKAPGESMKRPSKTSAPPPPPPDEVEEASIESFPASDAPGYGTGHV